LGLSFDVEDRHLFMASSVGVAIYPQHGSDAVMLMKSADAAMYVAKEKGGNGVCLFGA
jgi:GGDEF domain-containing protein